MLFRKKEEAETPRHPVDSMNFSYGDVLLGSLTYNSGELVKKIASQEQRERIKPFLMPDLFKEIMLFMQIYMLMNDEISQEATDKLRASMMEISRELDFPAKLRFWMDELR